MHLALAAFAVATLVTMALTPLMRGAALALGLVDRPHGHKSHRSPIPYLGGVAIMAGTLVAALLGVGRGGAGGVIVPAAAALGVVGLLDDDRTLQPLPRLLTQVVAAGAVIAAGVRADVTGILAFDIVLTLIWIVGVTNAVNFLDNMDGLAAGVTGAGAGAAFVLAAMNGQVGVATLAAALAGACLGFLAFNARPATIFMGDAGSLFLGFLLATLVLEVQPEFVVPPASFAVPLLLVAIPVLDIATVIVSRLRRGIRVSTGGQNHLSHRLEARGLSRGSAVGALVAAEAVVGVLAVLVGRGLMPVLAAALAAGVVVVVLTAATATADVHSKDVVGFPRRLRLGVGAAVLAVVLVAAPALVTLLLAGHSVSAGADASERALAAAQHGDASRAARSFAEAASAFARAERRLDSPLIWPGLAVPILNANLDTVRTVSDVGSELATRGERLTSLERVQIRDGVVPLDELRRLAPELAATASTLRGAAARTAAADRA
jgi:UDP-GlcNAc:undecaprenyl-phosphate GlcNAc-1-phosphate transferase